MKSSGLHLYHIHQTQTSLTILLLWSNFAPNKQSAANFDEPVAKSMKRL